MIHRPEVMFGSSSASDPGISCFDGLAFEVAAYDLSDVVSGLKRIESAIHEGYYAAGFLSYEAASALDESFPTRAPAGFPLMWFGIFRERRLLASEELFGSLRPQSYGLSGWRPNISRESYRKAVDGIRDYIAAGDIYQVNFTMKEHCSFSGEPLDFFRDLCRAQPTPYSAFFDLERYGVLSTSPELFFKLDSGVLTVRPMKGTAGRGRRLQEDREIIANLRKNEKERAENLMIVDLLRNDLGRVSENGSVKVDSLFDVETLETVHQMTSTISSRMRPDVGLVDLFRALFPCGSITGAPKKRSMEIIAEMEGSPRGLYTGCIGYLSPGMRQAVFSVAIRTVVIDKEAGTGELGVGSGITWYSAPDAEYDECRAKGLFARSIQRDFTLIESLLHEEKSGYFLIERHLERLSMSARFFGFSFNADETRSRLEYLSMSLSGSSKVRLVLSRDGSLEIEAEPITDGGNRAGSAIAFADTIVDSANPFLYHKTGNRETCLRELEKRPDCLDVVFANERGEVTEGANNNIVIRLGGLLVTPPVTCGLLPGTFRAHLLEKGEIAERVITRSDVEQADEVYLINSVRKWRRVRLVKGAAQ